MPAFHTEAGAKPKLAERTGDGASQRDVVALREPPLERRAEVAEVQLDRSEPRHRRTGAVPSTCFGPLTEILCVPPREALPPPAAPSLSSAYAAVDSSNR